MAKNIFVVEDDPNILEVIPLVLNKKDYDFFLCRSIDSFHGAILKRIPDLIIMEILLPGGNVLELCRLLKARLEDSTKILLMSTADYSSFQYADCADEFIRKPFDIEHFRGAVSVLLACHNKVSLN